jgi:hypothetical protein
VARSAYLIKAAQLLGLGLDPVDELEELGRLGGGRTGRRDDARRQVLDGPLVVGLQAAPAAQIVHRVEAVDDLERHLAQLHQHRRDLDLLLVERHAVRALGVFDLLQQEDDLGRLLVELLEVGEQLLVERDGLEVAGHERGDEVDGLERQRRGGGRRREAPQPGKELLLELGAADERTRHQLQHHAVHLGRPCRVPHVTHA